MSSGLENSFSVVEARKRQQGAKRESDLARVVVSEPGRNSEDATRLNTHH